MKYFQHPYFNKVVPFFIGYDTTEKILFGSDFSEFNYQFNTNNKIKIKFERLTLKNNDNIIAELTHELLLNKPIFLNIIKKNIYNNFYKYYNFLENTKYKKNEFSEIISDYEGTFNQKNSIISIMDSLTIVSSLPVTAIIY
jgi:hypothetical protein